MPCHKLHFKAHVNNLVANIAGAAPVTDPRLVNAWGIVTYGNTLWVAANDNGTILNYDLNGTILPTAIVVPGGAPTGIIVNRTTNFLITNGPVTLPATFLIATENGIIAGYNAAVDPVNAITVIDRSGVGAVYTGIAIANNQIYATDFYNRRIDVFNANYALLTGFMFADLVYRNNIPADFAPFNIANLHGRLYVTYAKQNPDNLAEDLPGAGNGYINIYDYNGLFVRRFASNGDLNSPWGLAFAPENFCDAACNLLVGNFGDGTINAHDHCGKFHGQLRDKCGKVIVIDGLWGLIVYKQRLYFAAGPADEANGLVGVITDKKFRKPKIAPVINSFDEDSEDSFTKYNYYDNYNFSGCSCYY